MKTGRLLIADDNKGILSALSLLLQDDFGEIVTLTNPNRIPALLEETEFDVVLLDMNFSAGMQTGNEGLFWLSRILEIRPETGVVLFTAFGQVELAVEALKRGGADFILKPWDNDKLRATLQTVLRLQQSRKKIRELKQKETALIGEINREGLPLIARSPQMLQVISLVRKVAKTDANVLITGDNGTGKELIAKELHRQSARASQILVCVDMGAITDTLFESELFGHKKGSFTDAGSDRTGKIECANGGTLFLDEIGNLPLHLQSKLLSVLERREVVPVGGNRPVPVDIRLVCATNRNLEEMVAGGQFREDLLYRINTIQIDVPPLRERVGDIPAIARFYLDLYARKYRKPGLGISPEALNRLEGYAWPGNVRELQHTMEKAVILSEKSLLEPDDFIFRTSGPELYDLFDGTLEEMEKILIGKALQTPGSNLTLIAARLGISRPTLYSKMKKYGY